MRILYRREPRAKALNSTTVGWYKNPVHVASYVTNFRDATVNRKENEKMSEEKKLEAKDIIDENVILLKAELEAKTKLVEDLAKALDDMTKKYTQAQDFIETDARAKLVADIAPRTTVSKEILVRMPLVELKRMKETLDVAQLPAFKSGTPLVTKDSPRVKLDNMYSDYMKKIRGGK